MDGQTQLDVWNGTYCNRVDGTDGNNLRFCFYADSSEFREKYANFFFKFLQISFKTCEFLPKYTNFFQNMRISSKICFFLKIRKFLSNLLVSGMIYPPYQTTKEPILIFIHQFCRTIELNFWLKSNFFGIPTAVFTNRFDYVGSDEKSRCFCRPLDKCPKMGTIDIMPCVGAPVIISLPHFLHGDPSLLVPIGSGLEPHAKNHEFFLKMEMVSKLSPVSF